MPAAIAKPLSRRYPPKFMNASNPGGCSPETRVRACTKYSHMPCVACDYKIRKHFRILPFVRSCGQNCSPLLGNLASQKMGTSEGLYQQEKSVACHVTMSDTHLFSFSPQACHHAMPRNGIHCQEGVDIYATERHRSGCTWSPSGQGKCAQLVEKSNYSCLPF